jgi:hypothetical protein
LASAARLYFRGLGKEANSATSMTPSTSFTQITGTRSRNNADAIMLRGEFRINTSTGETSNPTLAVSGDNAGIFMALVEADPDTTAPTVSSKTVSANGTTLTLVFSEAVTETDATGWTFTADGTPVTMTYSSGSGTNTLVYTLGTTVNMGQTCLISYDSGVGNCVDVTGLPVPNEVVTFSNSAVTNNSTQVSSFPLYTVGFF